MSALKKTALEELKGVAKSRDLPFVSRETSAKSDNTSRRRHKRNCSLIHLPHNQDDLTLHFKVLRVVDNDRLHGWVSWLQTNSAALSINML